ncbi:thiol:disulfide interchange protein DsbA/DsbL [Campylobacter sp. 9BO]|uniref:thiol:disulfide interchange protein DsbA/DsbL n=1 Tax=Campylobacter sp. 9BO TaxID=3424759 RepID=UPI003D32DF11
MKTMFSKTLKVLSAVALFGALSANAFNEGEDYIVLDKPLSVEKGTLTKVFSYACPFCYKYDKSVTPAVVKKVEGLKYEPFHLKTKANEHGEGETASKLLAVAVVKDRAANKDLFADDSLFKKVKMAYYKSYHDKKQRFSSADEFLKLGLDASGISKEDYEKELANPEVVELLKKWEESYDVAKIQGVPAFVVNGKYLIYTAKITSIDGMANLIKELIAK